MAEQQIGFCTTSDGVGIAYATVGEGPPLVYVTGWPGHLAIEWEKPHAREFIEALGAGFTLIRYDMRGSGLSDRDVDDFSFDTLLKDLEAVVDSVGYEQVPLLALGFLAGPLAIAYAHAHAERVSALALSSAYMRGADLMTEERRRVIVDYIRAFGFPMSVDIPKDQFAEFQASQEIQKDAASLEVQASVAQAILDADASGLVDALEMPTLVVHGRADEVVPFKLGRELAARIPQATFVPFEGSGAAPWSQRNIIIPEVHRFLGVEAEVVEAAPEPEQDTPAVPLAILFTDLASSTNITQRLGDALAQEIVRTHDRIVRDALRAHSGTEIKHTGDGIMASLPSASAGLECAIAIQRGVAAAQLERGDATDELSVRIGLNVGEPVAEGHDLFGTSVQLASRICDRAEPDQILASNVVRELAAGKGFLFADLGEVIPKGFEEPVRLFEVRWRS